MQNTLLILVVAGFIAWYYFQKYEESRNEYHRLFEENMRIKARIEDLEIYKRDISKTFEILDNELVVINQHIQRQADNNEPQDTFESNSVSEPINASVSVITPEFLSSLMGEGSNGYEKYLLEENKVLS